MINIYNKLIKGNVVIIEDSDTLEEVEQKLKGVISDLICIPFKLYSEFAEYLNIKTSDGDFHFTCIMQYDNKDQLNRLLNPKAYKFKVVRLLDDYENNN